MLDDYIKELIATNNRVIIPNFGAFLLRATSKNKNKKALEDKIEDIYFSPFLKFNDELLVNHIIQKEGGDQTGAMEKVKEYIKTIEGQVKDQGSYTIEDLGNFYMDDQGKIQFKIRQGAEKGAEEAATGPEKTTTEEEQPDKQQKESPPSKTVNEKAGGGKKTVGSSANGKMSEAKKPKQETSAPDNKAESQQASSRASQPQDKTSQKQATGARTGSQGKSRAGSTSRSAGKAASKTSGSPAGSKSPPPPPSKSAGDKSGSGGNRGLILSIAIGVPVAVVFIWAMLNFDTVQDLFRKDSNQMNLTEQQAQKSSMGGQQPSADKKAADRQAQQKKTSQQAAGQKSGQKAEKQTPGRSATKQGGTEQQASAPQTQKQQDARQSQAASTGKKYYLVAGSFKKRQNAVDFRKKLLEQGYNSEMIGERDGMHAVSYASFREKSKAQAELRRLRQEKGLTTWLLYY
jgi:cell division septation protein DedD/nucleoid DNA-binding protein